MKKMGLKRKKKTVASRREIAGWLFVSPFVVGLLFVFLPSFIDTIRYSFNKITIQPGGYSLEFRGWEYYKNALFVHATYNQHLTATLLTMLLHVPLVLVFSLFMAVLLSGKFRGRNLMQFVLFMPVITSAGAMAALNNVTVTADGLLSAGYSMNGSQAMQMSSTWLLDSLGLSDKLKSYFSMALSNLYTIITSSGIQVLIFIAAIKSIPESVYEAAKMEGATAWESFWKVTFPMVSPYILTNTVYSIVNSLSSNTSRVLRIISMVALSINMDLSLSSAMAMIFCLVELLFLAVVMFLISRLVFYYD